MLLVMGALKYFGNGTDPAKKSEKSGFLFLRKNNNFIDKGSCKVIE